MNMIRYEHKDGKRVLYVTGGPEKAGEDFVEAFEGLAQECGPGWALFNAHYMLEIARKMANEAGVDAVIESIVNPVKPDFVDD